MRSQTDGASGTSSADAYNSFATASRQALDSDLDAAAPPAGAAGVGAGGAAAKGANLGRSGSLFNRWGGQAGRSKSKSGVPA